MELYDKKYVYFEWDDELEGKKVFCATSIEDLKFKVNYGNAQTGVLHHSNNPKGHPFVPTWSDGSGSIAYPFAYYDPNYEVKKAYNEGKKLQWKYSDEEEWNDWNGVSLPTFFDDYDYELRVKPEECIDYDTGVIGNKVLDRPLTKELEKDRYLTNKEFAMWLAKGNGQWKQIKYGLIQTSDAYIGQDDETIDYDILVRRWEDKDWHKPTYNYCFK